MEVNKRNQEKAKKLYWAKVENVIETLIEEFKNRYTRSGNRKELFHNEFRDYNYLLFPKHPRHTSKFDGYPTAMYKDVYNRLVINGECEYLHTDAEKSLNFYVSTNMEKIYINVWAFHKYMKFLEQCYIVYSKSNFVVAWDEIVEKKNDNQAFVKSEEKEVRPKSRSSFKELFKDSRLIEPCIKVLRETDEPLVSKKNNYIGNSKSAFVVWFEVLKLNDFVHPCTDKEFLLILNNMFPGLKMSKDGGLFRKNNPRAVEKYKKEFKVKLSQLYQNYHHGRL